MEYWGLEDSRMCGTTKSSLLGKMTVLLVICCCSLPAQAKYGGGSGEPNDPYLIYTAEQMNEIGLTVNSGDWDKCFKLMADIDLGTLPPPPPPPSLFQASNPNPADGTFSVATTADLSWTPGLGATSHDVYFGTTRSPSFVCNQTSTTFDPGTMASTTYYWRIDEVNDSVTTTGDIWSFTTIMTPPPPPPPPLTVDIDLSGYSETAFNIIGTPDNPFTGVFDGNAHAISNFSYTSIDKSYIGLFGYVGVRPGNAEIKNLYLVDPNINADNSDYVGSLVGYFASGKIINCCAKNGSVSARNQVGGLVGITGNYASIYSSYHEGTVNGEDKIGGLVGDSIGLISNCYAFGTINGVAEIGGLVGVNNSSPRKYAGRIENCYSTTRVNGTFDEGGLIGQNIGIVRDSYWDVEASGEPNSAGGIGKTTSQMQTASTFDKWRCDSAWTIEEAVDYPHLAWERYPGILLAPPVYGGGNGTEDDPFLIYTAEQFNMIGPIECHMNKHFRLMADIDLSDYTGTELNLVGTDGTSFSGTFDGNNHVIFNFIYNCSEGDCIGIFGIASGAEIRNLGLIGPVVDGTVSSNVGAIVGFMHDGTIENCYVKGGNVFGSNSVGGLVGRINNYGLVMDCYAETNVTATGTSAGSIAGRVYHGKVTGSYANGSVSGNTSVGGLIGTGRWCDIKDSYSSSDTYGIENVGGLLGYAEFENNILVNCYATGIVSGSKNSGGLIGKSISSTVSDCYWDIETTGQPTSEGGGTGKTTAQMKDIETYLGWSCETKWTIDERKDYPRLLWENMLGQIISRPLEVYGGGTGTENDPYLLYTPEQFNSIGLFECDWDKQFKLMTDIDIGCYTGAEFNVTGHSRNSFRGVLDGNGKRVLNFTVDVVGRAYNGIFGFVSGDAEIRNLTIVNPDVNTYGDYTGALIGLVPGNNVIVYNCHIVNGTVSGRLYTGGLVGSSIYSNSIKITECSTSCNVNGGSHVGGLVGFFSDGNISNCLSKGNVTGTGDCVGGLVGRASNPATIDNSLSRGNVSGGDEVGGLIGKVWDYWYPVRVIKCYSVGKVQGDNRVGGLIGSMFHPLGVENSFWDVQTSGVLYSEGGIGLTTSQMQTRNMYINAGWDFMGETINGTDDFWWILEGIDYPWLSWELVPVLHAEPKVTLGTSNNISWEPVVGVIYIAECAEDADFTSIIYSTGWITETSCEFTSLQLGKRYWYSVKAITSEGFESSWSNVESSLQCNLSDAVETLLSPEDLKNKNMKYSLVNKIDEALQMIDEGLYKVALNKLENDILQKTNGCGQTGEPDKNDWIITCEEQSEVYPLIIETIEHVKGLME
jgi:hypothetical protein